ncbi:hypothetical protein GCM10017786_48980 [Amycolatopsis deserti]|uniref:PE domain-containing protein n=1 Tax=Amycolatopsis deserti TaxID=185696 RepID=A0ABQ3JB93_9PSEU|nr:hypothetical protein [Amycolatopsis deserti]GHF09643.1 hypothetical protein GCM10017786_48980 [Amycolatopsis deserti]
MPENVTNIASQVANVFGGEQQLNTMTADAKRMLADAQAGRWAVDEETGSHLRRAVSHMQDQLTDVSRRIYLLKQAPKFGNDEYAKMASTHFLHAMNGDDRSLVQVFEAAREMLTTLNQAIEIAISKYDSADEAASQALGKFKDQGAR